MGDLRGHDLQGGDQRIIRLRRDDLRAQAERIVPRRSEGTPTQLVQIYDGGAMPSSPDCFYLGYPVQASGTEAEGGAGTTSPDVANAIVVDVLGRAPSIGDILTAYAVAGRWVAERGSESTGFAPLSCNPCPIPEQSLLLSWTNLLGGNGSATLTFMHGDAISFWQSDCANGLLYQLYCTASQIELRILYFVSGFCPAGQTAYCSNLRAAPSGLTLVSYTCVPFSLSFQTTLLSCPVLVNNGYQSFTVTL
jgi:hypothetical protein